MAGHGWGFALWIYDNFSRSPTSRTIGDTLLLLSTPEADTEYPLVDKLSVEDRADPADIPGLDPTRKEKTFTSVFSRRRKGKAGHDDKMHKTNTKRTDDVAVARPVENAEECATSLAAADNKKGSQVHKTLSTENRDVTIARPNTSGPKKKTIKRAKHSTDSAVLHTKGKGDEGSNDGGNPISSSQVLLYDPRVEGREVDTSVEETVEKRTKRSLPSKDSEKEVLPAKRRRVGKKLLPSEDSEASSDKDNLMSQMSIQTIIDAAKQLERIPELIQSVRDAGFGPFIDTKIKGSINRKCMSFILKNIDTSTMTVKFSEEKKIEINRYAIHHLYGIPNGHLSAPRPNETSEVLPELKRELGFKSDEDINAKKLLVILTSMVDGHLSSKAVINKNLALKIFYLILLNKGLCVGVGPRITAKEASMVKGLDYGRIKDMDFCQLVVDELQTSATNWQAYKKLKYKHMEGLAVAPLIMYLDSLIYKDLAHMGKETPRVLVLDDKNLTAISKADRNMGAQKGKEDWAFGKIIDAEADRPEIVTSAATITGMSTDKLAESLDPKDQDKTCTSQSTTEEVQNPSDYLQGGIQATDEQQACIGEQQLREPPLLQSIRLDLFYLQKNPSRNQPLKRLDAETSNVNAEADAPDVETSAASVSEKSADMLAESPDRNDQNIKSASATNTEEVQNPKDYMQGEQAEHGFVPDVAHADQCTSDNLLEDCVEGSKARIEDENSAAEELCNKATMTSSKCLHERLNKLTKKPEELSYWNQKFIRYGEMDVTIGEVADSFEDGAPIKTNIMTIMIKIPCFEEGDEECPVGHYFVMSVNLKRKRFELLDSLGGGGAEQHFVNMADVFKEIWKEAYRQSNGELSPGNLDDFSYEKPKVIPLQGETLNCGVYMMMFLMFWNGKSLFYIRQNDILYIRKRLLYLVLRWENLEVNLDLIETIDKDKLKKITSGQYNLVGKTRPVKPTMVVIVGLPDVNIPEPREIDDGKENYTEEQEYVLIGSQEDYNMECLKGRGRAEETTKNGEEDKETTKSGEEDKNQKQQKSVVARNNEDNNIEYLRTREAKVDDPSRLHQVLFTPINRNSSSPPGYKIDKDMYCSLTGSQSLETPPKVSKSNYVDVEHRTNLDKRKRDIVTPSNVTSTKRPRASAKKFCEPVPNHRPKKFKHQKNANMLYDLLLKKKKYDGTEVFNAPVMHSSIPDLTSSYTGADIKEQFGVGELLDGTTMDYIIDEMRSTSDLYATGERVLLSQGFIMHVLQVNVWKQTPEEVEEAAQKRDDTTSYTEEAMQYSRRSTGSRTQEPAHANLLVYHRRSARERELADERNRAFLEQEAVGGLEQLGECLVRTAIMALPSPNAPPNIRRACRPSMPSMAELPRRVDGLHPREARNQHICAGEYPPLEHLERALEGQYMHALVPPETEKEVTASIVLCKVKRAMKRWLIRGIDASLTPLDSAVVSAFVPCRVIGRNNKHWVGANGDWVAFVQDQAQWTLLNVYTKAEITLPSIRNVGIHPDDHFRYHWEMASLVLLKIQITGEPFLFEGRWHYCAIAVFDKTIAIMMGGTDSDWRILKNDFLRPSLYADAIYDEGRIYAITEPRGDVLVWQPMEYGEAVGIPTNYKGKNVWNCPSLHCEVYARNGQVTDPVDTVWVRQGDLQGSSLFLGVNYPFLLDAPEPEAHNAGNTFPLFKPDSVFAAPNYVNHILRFPDWCRIPVDGGASVGSTFVWLELNWGEFHEVPMWFVPTLPWPDM
ncbi:hypothetical protein ACQ4PT_015247 [Festuca glaucescens]